MRCEAQDAALLGERLHDNREIVRHDAIDAFGIAQPDVWQLQDHRAGFPGGAPRKGGVGVACLRGIGAQPIPVATGKRVKQPAKHATNGVQRAQRQQREQAKQDQ